MGFALVPTVGAHDAPPHVQTPIGWRGPVTRTPIRPATRRLWRLNLAGVCRLPPIQINYGYTTAGRCMVPEIYLFYKSCFLGPTCLCQGYWCRLPAAAWYPKFIYFISRAFLVLHVSAKDIGVGYPILEVSGNEI